MKAIKRNHTNMPPIQFRCRVIMNFNFEVTSLNHWPADINGISGTAQRLHREFIVGRLQFYKKPHFLRIKETIRVKIIEIHRV